MEHEIEKLKQAYLATKPPTELEFYGYEDVMDRIKNKRNSLPIYRFVGMVIVIFIAISGFAGVTLASKPNSTLYPLRVAAQNAIANITHTSPKNIEETIDNIISPKKVTPTIAPVIIQSAPTPTSIPTPIEKKNIRNERENEKSDESHDEQKREQKEEEVHTEEVKGVSTTKEPEKKEEVKTQQNQEHDDGKKQSENSSSSNKNNSGDRDED